MDESLRSMGIVREEVQIERQLQLTHADSLDTKAGVILGFAGALVALTSASVGSLALDGARFCGAASGGLAIVAFWPRRARMTNVRLLRDRYLSSERAFTELRLLDTQIRAVEDMHRFLAMKALRLRVSMVVLLAAITLTAVGLGMH